MIAGVVLLALATSADGLGISGQARFKLRRGPDAVCNDAAMENVAWGVVIDGRDASKGPNAYGESYITRVLRQVRGAQKAGENAGPELQYSDWVGLTKNRHERTYNNPISNEVRTCQKDVFAKDRIEQIFQSIKIMDRSYKDKLDTKKAKTYEEAITPVFKEYNEKQKAAQNDNDKLHAIAFLMLNMAYLHPLADENGRSRLLLTQHELRRLNLACGTMMYNNNKDIYFQTASEFVEKLKEGILMYQKAQDTGKNPWQDADAVKKHYASFPDVNKKKLDSCWHNFCNKDWNDHSVQGHKACTGTAIALRQKMKDAMFFSELKGEERPRLP